MDLERSDNSETADDAKKSLAPDSIRVSDNEREQVVSLLGEAAGEGRLTLDEYTERVDQAYAAKTRGELTPLLADLPVAAPDFQIARPVAAPGTVARSPAGGPATTAASDRLIAIFGEDSRKGSWIVPARLEARAIFGSCELHFQDAQIQHPVTRIEATALFGSVTIFVPEGVEVRMAGPAIFGSKESKLHEPPRPGSPIIEVMCQVAFGSVEVRPPKRRWLTKRDRDQ